MPKHFSAQCHIDIEPGTTDLHSVNVTLFDLGELFHVDSTYKIFRSKVVDGKYTGGFTHEELLVSEKFDYSRFEAEQAYHVQCLKAFTRISQLDKNSDQTHLDAIAMEMSPLD